MINHHQLLHIDQEIISSIMEAVSDSERHEFLNEIVDLYIKATPQIINDLRAAIADTDIKGVLYHAHRLKGSSASIGASAVASLSEILELDATEGRISADRSLVEQIEKMFAETQKEFVLFCSEV